MGYSQWELLVGSIILRDMLAVPGAWSGRAPRPVVPRGGGWLDGRFAISEASRGRQDPRACAQGARSNLIRELDMKIDPSIFRTYVVLVYYSTRFLLLIYYSFEYYTRAYTEYVLFLVHYVLSNVKFEYAIF